MWWQTYVLISNYEHYIHSIVATVRALKFNHYIQIVIRTET
jgi:hypothetical protein